MPEIKKQKVEKYKAQVAEINLKKKENYIKKYGVDHQWKRPEIRQKSIESLKQHWGAVNPSLSPEIQAIKQERQRVAFVQKLKENLDQVEWLDSDSYTGVYPGQQVYYTFRCLKCDSQFQDYLHSHQPCCPNCYPGNVSLKEKELVAYIKSIYSGPILEKDRTLIAPKEIDIYLPDLKIAIEYDGSFWHGYSKYTAMPINEFKKLSEQKRLMCQNKGVRLVTVGEYDYEQRPAVFQRFLNDLICPRTRIYARNCEIKPLDTQTARSFCEYYHVNGYRGGRYKYGLFYKDDLIAVAIFALYKQEHECIRLCYKTGIDVIGGWAKIQKHFGKRFLHYVNLQYFSGTNKTGVGYRILSNGKLLHRQSFWGKSSFKKCIEDGAIAIFDLGNDIRWYN